MSNGGLEFVAVGKFPVRDVLCLVEYCRERPVWRDGGRYAAGNYGIVFFSGSRTVEEAVISALQAAREGKNPKSHYVGSVEFYDPSEARRTDVSELEPSTTVEVRALRPVGGVPVVGVDFDAVRSAFIATMTAALEGAG